MPLLTGTLEDREQIRELYARYANHADTVRTEDWVALFTDDGVFESPIYGTFAGPAGLRQFMGQYSASWNGGGVRHMIVNVSVDVQGDEATGTCGLIYFKVHDGRSELQLTGGYHDRLRKVGGEWRFSHRKVYVDG